MVAALLAVLVAVAVPRLVVPETLHVRSCAREVASDLRLAQRLAMARRATIVLEFSPGAGPYTRYTVRRQGGGDEPGFPKGIPTEVAVTGPQSFEFSSGGGAASGGTVTVSGGGATATLQVNAVTGHVRVSGP